MTRFKNYFNSVTREPLIYSDRDLMQMPVSDALDNELSIMAQHKQIGIPSVDELRASSNTVWVDAYTRDDGIEVCGHWRSKPDGGSSNGGASGMKGEGLLAQKTEPIIFDEKDKDDKPEQTFDPKKAVFLSESEEGLESEQGEADEVQGDSSNNEGSDGSEADKDIDKKKVPLKDVLTNFVKEGFDPDNNMDLFEEVLGFGFEKFSNKILPMSSNGVIDGMHDLEAARKNPEAKIYNKTSEIQDGYIKRQLEKFGAKPNAPCGRVFT